MTDAHTVEPVSSEGLVSRCLSPVPHDFSQTHHPESAQPGSSALGTGMGMRMLYARFDLRTSFFPNSRFNSTRVAQDGSRVCLFRCSLPPPHPSPPHPVDSQRVLADLPSFMLFRVHSPADNLPILYRPITMAVGSSTDDGPPYCPGAALPTFPGPRDQGLHRGL